MLFHTQDNTCDRGSKKKSRMQSYVLRKACTAHIISLMPLTGVGICKSKALGGLGPSCMPSTRPLSSQGTHTRSPRTHTFYVCTCSNPHVRATACDFSPVPQGPPSTGPVSIPSAHTRSSSGIDNPQLREKQGHYLEHSTRGQFFLL